MLDAPHPDKHVDLCSCSLDHRDYVRDRSNPRDDGCWEWTLGHSWDGYGRLTHRGFVWGAHRFSYEAFYVNLKCRCEPCRAANRDYQRTSEAS